MQGCNWAGTHGNAVPINILARERLSHKCVSCKWEHWCYSIPITISNSRSCTAECERGFSCMNLTMTDLRSTVLIDLVASLMFINIHGPPVYLATKQALIFTVITYKSICMLYFVFFYLFHGQCLLLHGRPN